MKRIVLFSVLFIGLSSCEKENKTCWRCTFTYSTNLIIPPPRTVCNDGEYPKDLKDEFGNDTSFTCEKQ